MRTLKAYVHLGYGFGASTYRAKYAAGLVPDETPYGFHHAETMGCDVTYSVDARESKVGNLLRRSLLRVLGFDLVHAWRNRNLMQAADVVWTMEEMQYLAVCALPFVVPGMKRQRLIAQTVWLFNKWSGYSAARRWILKRLLSRADRLTFHSRNYLRLVPELVPGLKPELLYFGISLDSFPWTKPTVALHTPMRILSMGNDATRDWATMLSAFGNDDRFEMRIVCNWLRDEQAALYGNLQCPRKPDMAEFRELYTWTDVVVVPMVENAYSGITVALEAASMGVPVVSSDTGGVPTYFDRGEALYVTPENPEALREAVLGCNQEQMGSLIVKAQERFLRDGYASRDMAARYVERSRAMMEAE